MKVLFKDWECTAVGTTYAENGRKAIVLRDSETGEPVATATVNLADVRIPDNCVFVKDYSENEGMLDTLYNHGIVESGAIVEVKSGYVFISAYRLTQEAINNLF